MTYRCLTDRFEELQKKVNRISKKLDKYGLNYKFEKIEDKVETFEVWDYSNPNNIPVSQYTPQYKGKIALSVTYYNFEMEEVKLGDYRVVAVIDHNTLTTDKNLIHNFTEDVIIPDHYKTAESHCEHCKSNRIRSKTVLLLNKITLELKQIGTTCVKEYTGIDAERVIKGLAELDNFICLEKVDYIDYAMMDSFRNRVYVSTEYYLANCIKFIELNGYIPNDTKTVSFYDTVSEIIAEDKLPEAKQIIEFFSTRNYTNDFLNNTKLSLEQEYTKANGFIAYAYLAYTKELAKEERNNKQKTGFNSVHQGTISEKIEITLKYIESHSCESQFGIQYIHIFEDKKGNVYKWTTAKRLEEPDPDNIIKIKGTIKDHTEFNGVKQTVLTRCKIL